MLGGLFKGGMLAIGLKGIALLAGKALMVAKIALVLSIIVGLSKLFGSGAARVQPHTKSSNIHISVTLTHIPAVTAILIQVAMSTRGVCRHKMLPSILIC